MRKILIAAAFGMLTACGNGNSENNADTTSTTESSSVGTMNTDTTSVNGSIQLGQGHLRTDTSVRGANASGK